MIQTTLIPIFDDNYVFLIEESSGITAIVDPGDPAPVKAALENKDLQLDYILNTHHHHDHVGGNEALKFIYNCRIIGPEKDKHRIPGIDQTVNENDVITLGETEFQIFETPGHTTGHIIYYAPDSNTCFCGDTLFSMGCGRLFEGTPDQMWNSLNKIKSLPDNTMIYCAHEYTAANGTFCLTIEPDNKDLQQRMNEVKALRNANKPTIPVSLKTEKQTNCFLRAQNSKHFAELRSKKDAF